MLVFPAMIGLFNVQLADAHLSTFHFTNLLPMASYSIATNRDCIDSNIH